MGLQKRQRVNRPYQGGHMCLGKRPNSWCVNVADVCLRLPRFKNSNRNYKVEEVIQYVGKKITYCVVKLFFKRNHSIKKKKKCWAYCRMIGTKKAVILTVHLQISVRVRPQIIRAVFKIGTLWIADLFFITFSSLMWLRFLLCWDHSVLIEAFWALGPQLDIL